MVSFPFMEKKNLINLDESSFLGLFGKSNPHLIVNLMHGPRYTHAIKKKATSILLKIGINMNI